MGLIWNQNNKCIDQIEIPAMTSHVSQYWCDTWHK